MLCSSMLRIRIGRREAIECNNFILRTKGYRVRLGKDLVRLWSFKIRNLRSLKTDKGDSLAFLELPEETLL